jgi:hypothetical protein
MLPEYDPTARPLGLTETRRAAGVAPEVGLAASQFPVEFAVTLKVSAGPVEPIFRTCAGGGELPAWAAKLRLIGLVVREEGVVITKVTGTTTVPDGTGWPRRAIPL